MNARNPKRLFVGFSTAETELTGNWRYYDTALIRRDLLNHFHTRLGERVMRPDFGCRVWDYMMEPLNAENVEAVTTEVRRVCESDSRVTVSDIAVSTLDSGIRVEVELIYAPLGVVDTFSVDFENREAARNGAAMME